jgi:hypothetical protein
VVLTALLLFAGLGSRCSERFVARRRTLLVITLAIAAGIVLLGGTTGALPVAWPAGAVARSLAAAALVAPVGLAMGTAFPTGLRFLAARAPGQLPWAWAINSSISVATPSLAMLIAVTGGHNAGFALAAVIYAGAALARARARDPACHT